MLLPIKPVALGALALTSSPLIQALSPADIPADTPISQLLASANAKFAAGETQEALTYYDVAITRDPKNYMTIFRRATTYLSLGRNKNAQLDFDRVLAIKPNHDGALTQRAKIKSRNADWSGAREDYKLAKKNDEVELLDAAELAASEAEAAAKRDDWEACVTNLSVAIMVAGTALDLRKLRAKCRFEQGQIMEGVSDLQHALQIASGATEPHLQISAMTFYSLGETDKGLAQARKCLQSDPESKQCMKLMKRERSLEKRLKNLRDLFEKRSFATAIRQLVTSGEDAGLIQDVKDDMAEYKKQGYIHQKAPDGLYQTLVEMTCEAYMERENRAKSAIYCDEVLTFNPEFVWSALNTAQTQMDAEDWEAAVRTLTDASERNSQNRKVHEKLNSAKKGLKISKQKDYYKVLGVSRDADERQIKKAYRGLTKQFHPDKAAAQGISKDEAEKKMAAVNEAYEVLKDPELKARFDNGDDPNNPEQQQQHPFQGSPFGGFGGGQQFMFRQGSGGGFPGGFPDGFFG